MQVRCIVYLTMIVFLFRSQYNQIFFMRQPSQGYNFIFLTIKTVNTLTASKTAKFYYKQL